MSEDANKTEGVRLWHLPSLAPSTQKRTEREPGADAPRVARTRQQMPRVLFSAPECRVVIIELEGGEELGDHHVRERAVVEVITGSVAVECAGATLECGVGTLLTFDPGVRHAIRAAATARLLLILAPWPAAQRYTEADTAHEDHLPINALVEPD